MLNGVGPTILPAVKERLEEPVEFDDAAAVAAELLHMQALIRRNLVVAGDNLAIARGLLPYGAGFAALRTGQGWPVPSY